MAAVATVVTDDQKCLMCLEAPAVLTISTCQHPYCQSCLDKYKAKEPEAETLPCPTCRVQCPERTSAKEDTNEATVLLGGDNTRLEQEATASGAGEVVDAVWEKCKACGHNDKETQAESICWECSNLPLCKDCRLVHGKSKAMQNHVVTTLRSFKKEDFLCRAHGEPLKSFCCTCTKPLCPVCVMSEHGDHEIKSLGDVCLTKTEEVKTGMETEVKRLETLQLDEKEMEESRATAIKMEDIIIKAIEDQAEMCIEQILKNKDALKKQVKKEFEVIWELTKCLEALPKLIAESEKVITKAKTLLENMELAPKYLEELWKTKLNEEFHRRKSGQPEYERCKENNRRAFESLKKKSITFHPKTPKLDIGGIEKPDPEKLKAICKGKGYCVCETCGRVPKADTSRRGECDKVGACTCGTCALRIAKASSKRKAECEREGSCRCAVCDSRLPKASPQKRGECETQGSCRCAVCDLLLPKASRWRRRECEKLGSCACRTCDHSIPIPNRNNFRQCNTNGCQCRICDRHIPYPSSSNNHKCRRKGYCRCKICDDKIITPECKRIGWISDSESCSCPSCYHRLDGRCLLLCSLLVLGLVVILFMYMFSYFSDHPTCPAVEKHNLLSFTTHEQRDTTSTPAVEVTLERILGVVRGRSTRAEYEHRLASTISQVGQNTPKL